ncbi:MAG: lipopolysaccharide biosynthesis protein [Hyphomonas sp.]|nr:lipopolysaccharide biosynthesis protein [Hyphomonas sp.]
MTDHQSLAPSAATPGPSGIAPMGQRVAKGAIWTMAANAARIASAILILPVLTRLLSPEDFGLIQIAAPFLFFLMVFSDLGMQPALVVADKPSDKLWSTAFWTGMGAAAGLTLILILAAPAVALFFKEPRAELILQVLAITMLIGGTMIVPGAWLLRNMKFRTLAIVEFSSVTAGIVAALACALMGWGVWSLVVQQLVMFSLKAAALCTASKAPLKFEFAVAELRSIMGVSWGMTNVRILWFFSRSIDMIIIGRFLGATVLGYYSIAWRIMMMPIEIFASGLFQVLMPTMGQIKNDANRLKAALLKTYRTISLFTFPAMAGIAALSVPLTDVLFGEQFAPAAYPIAALAVHGALQSLLTVQATVFMALGRIDVMYKWSLVTLVTLGTCLLIGVQWGLKGAALGYLVSTLICAPLNFRAMLNLVGANLSDAWKALRVQTLLAIGMGLSVYGLTRLLPAEWPNIYLLFVGVPVGVILYAGGLFLVDRKAIDDIFAIARSVLSKTSVA